MSEQKQRLFSGRSNWGEEVLKHIIALAKFLLLLFVCLFLAFWTRRGGEKEILSVVASLIDQEGMASSCHGLSRPLPPAMGHSSLSCPLLYP